MPQKLPEDNFVYFYHPDHVGSTSYVTDYDGALYEHVQYFPFGETWVSEQSNTERLPYLFTSKELDEETQLYYFGARYYDPRTSVWQSTDPALASFLPRRGSEPKTSRGGGVYVPLNLGMLTYAWQNPIRLIDRHGLETESGSVLENVRIRPSPARVTRLPHRTVAGFQLGRTHDGTYPYQRIPESARKRLDPLLKQWGFETGDIRVVVKPLPRSGQAAVLGKHHRANVILLNESLFTDFVDPKAAVENTLLHETIHVLQERRLGKGAADRRSMVEEATYGSKGVYRVPPALQRIPLRHLDPTDWRFTLEAIAERVETELQTTRRTETR